MNLPAASPRSVAVLLAESAPDDPMPPGVAWTMGPFLILAGLLIAGVGVRARRGQLDRNRLIGIRTPRTLASDEAWDRTHAIAGPWLIAAGLVGSVIPGVAVLFRPSNRIAPVIILVGMALMVALTSVGGLLGHRATDPDP